MTQIHLLIQQGLNRNKILTIKFLKILHSKIIMILLKKLINQIRIFMLQTLQ
jgi:hypothetical protein